MRLELYCLLDLVSLKELYESQVAIASLGFMNLLSAEEVQAAKNFLLGQFIAKDREFLLAKDKGGFSVAHTVARFGKSKLFQLLIVAVGRDLLFATCNSGMTLLHIAALAAANLETITLLVAANLETMRLLVAAGGKSLVLVQDSDGHTALHFSIRVRGDPPGGLALQRLLIDAGGEELVLVKNIHGESALHLAAGAGHTEAARMLAAAGSKLLLLVTESKGHAALHYAAEKGHVAIVQLLTYAGGKELLFAKGVDGASALQARRRQHRCWLLQGARRYCFRITMGVQSCTTQLNSLLLDLSGSTENQPQ